MKKQNKERKKQIIVSGTFDSVRKQRHTLFENEEYEKLDNFLSYFDINGEQLTQEDFNCIRQLQNCRKKQISKIKKHVNWWLANGYKVYFGTFTYADKYNKNNLDDEKLAAILKRRLNRTITEFCDDYIMNVDFGRKKERLHYHILIAIKETNPILNEFEYVSVPRTKTGKNGEYFVKGKKPICKALRAYEKQVGFYDMELCKTDEKSSNRLSQYIDKLTIHSVKVKQTYVSVQKGTEYQQYLELNQAYYNEMKKAKREKTSKTLVIDNQFYLDNLRKYKSILSINKYCDIEYELLLQREKEKELKQKYIDSLKSKEFGIKIFDDLRTIDQKYDDKRNEILAKYSVKSGRNIPPYQVLPSANGGINPINLKQSERSKKQRL